MLDARSSSERQATSPVDADAVDRRARLAEALINTGRGDHAAFRLLYTLTTRKLFGICLQICGQRSAAEDVLADVYPAIWKRAGAWESRRGSAISWLAAIARNRAIDWRRARTKRGIEVTCDTHDIADGAANAEAALLSAEGDAQLHRCLDALLPEQRSAIRAAFFGGLTYAELASQRGVSLTAMKSRVRRGLLRMRHELQCDDQGFGPTLAIIKGSSEPRRRFQFAPTEFQPEGFGHRLAMTDRDTTIAIPATMPDTRRIAIPATMPDTRRVA